MSEVQATPVVGPAPPGLAARLIGVIFSPRETYAAVAAHPRALGALIVTLAIGCATQVAFLSTEIGQNALMDRQLEAMERFGVQVSDQMVQQMESRLAMAPYTTAGFQIVAGVAIGALVAALLLGVCNALLDGTAKFKQLFAIVAHAGVIPMLQQLFSAPINYARGEMASPASLGVFVPMLDPDGFVAGFLGAIDLFFVWWFISLAIGVGVLYKRPTGPIATALLAVYGVIAICIALIF